MTWKLIDQNGGIGMTWKAKPDRIDLPGGDIVMGADHGWSDGIWILVHDPSDEPAPMSASSRLDLFLASTGMTKQELEAWLHS